MARPARRAPSALRLELLESRTMLSHGGSLSGAPSSAIPSDTGSIQAQAQTRAIVPNDPGFSRQWGLGNAGRVDLDAPQAWGRTQGSASTIVAILDTGIDLENPEFAGRIWTNPDPSGSDGYPGALHGWNFVANTADVQDDDGHGTHVAGILAASGNDGIGVAGVDWNAQIMPLKVLDSGGVGSDVAMVRAIDFAVQHGARVINASWGGGAYSQAVADAIRDAGNHGVVFVTAAGNDGADDDSTPFYPASYRLPNEIVVTAVDESGHLPGFANFGKRTVDLAAPGVDVLSTIPGGYALMSGTSMAAPYVSGVVSLLVGLHPSYSSARLVQQVLASARPLSGLAGKTATGGIVDAARALGLDPKGPNAPRAALARQPLPAGPAIRAAMLPGSGPSPAHRHHTPRPGIQGGRDWGMRELRTSSRSGRDGRRPGGQGDGAAASHGTGNFSLPS